MFVYISRKGKRKLSELTQKQQEENPAASASSPASWPQNVCELMNRAEVTWTELINSTRVKLT